MLLLLLLLQTTLRRAWGPPIGEWMPGG